MLSTFLAAFLLSGAFPWAQVSVTEPELSPVELEVIRSRIAMLHSPADRGVANSWSSGKKVAELLCRPAALPAIRKQLPGTDRVFLGTDDPQTLVLESNERLAGTGSARTPKGWQDFTFACSMDASTAKVTGFTAVLAPTNK